LEAGIWKLASLRSGIEFKHRFAVFNRCCAAFKDLTSFDLQSQICGFQWVTSFFEYCEAVERHEVPLEFLIAEGV
jgi:hypothetical protein